MDKLFKENFRTVDMNQQKNYSIKINLKIILTFLFTYIILFEFILPYNKVLPKPDILYDSFIHIWKDYNILIEIANSASAIYLPLFVTYVILSFGSAFIPKFLNNYEILFKSFRVLSLLPLIFIIILIGFWFNNSLWGEFVLSFSAAMYFSLKCLYGEIKKVNEEYLLVAQNLKLTPKDFSKQILWKSAKPNLLKEYIKINNYLWSVVLVYEFIENINGLGIVYHSIYSYKDFVALFTLAILNVLLIWIINFIYKLILKKFFNQDI
jgi:ABC-type nitrate/sulfonate/bicarbonate transport system permease component